MKRTFISVICMVILLFSLSIRSAALSVRNVRMENHSQYRSYIAEAKGDNLPYVTNIIHYKQIAALDNFEEYVGSQSSFDKITCFLEDVCDKFKLIACTSSWDQELESLICSYSYRKYDGYYLEDIHISKK